jgi:hypothetical protein
MTKLLLLVWALQGFEGQGYVTANPAALLSAIHSPYTRGNAGLLTHLEYGAAVGVGVFLSEQVRVETRLSAGPVNQVTRAYQSQVGIHYFLKEFFYVGGGLRLWDLHYPRPQHHYVHLAPLVNAGLVWPLAERWFLDARAAQFIGVAAFPLRDDATTGWHWFPSPAPEISPVLPIAMVGIGYNFAP